MRTTISAIAMALGCAAAAGAAPVKERLVLAPYPGRPAWKTITNKSAGDQFYREQIPGNQTVDNFTDILTSQNFPRSAASILPSTCATSSRRRPAIATAYGSTARRPPRRAVTASPTARSSAASRRASPLG